MNVEQRQKSLRRLSKSPEASPSYKKKSRTGWRMDDASDGGYKYRQQERERELQPKRGMRCRSRDEAPQSTKREKEG